MQGLVQLLGSNDVNIVTCAAGILSNLVSLDTQYFVSKLDIHQKMRPCLIDLQQPKKQSCCLPVWRC